MNKAKKLLIIGGDRLGNYETLAPIANHLLQDHEYKFLTLFQDEKLIREIQSNNILNLLYSQGRMIVLRKYSAIIGILEVLYFVLLSKGGLVITNRPLSSFKFKLLKVLLAFQKWKVIYTKSFSRSPTENVRALIGGKGYALPKEGLADFCLIPTSEHMIEYGILGYRLSNMIVTGYPKTWRSWKNFVNLNTFCESQFDYLIALGIYYDDYEKILREILISIDSVNPESVISIKPHPTTKSSIVQKIIHDSNVKAKVEINFNNVASQSICSKRTIVHGTSSCIDAGIGSKVICYWGKDKSLVDKYNESTYNNSPDFAIMESNKACRDFVDDECYDLIDLQKKLSVESHIKVSSEKLPEYQDFDLIRAIKK